jgi:hypothetical protein
MNVVRIAKTAAIGAALGGTALIAQPASAQFFLQSRDLTGQPVTGTEPGILPPMPGATDAEMRAALVWNLRAALNVAALQCQFEPLLNTRDTYNAIVDDDHGVEFKAAFDVVSKYFTRTAKTKAAGQQALDMYNTRVYASFTPVAAQYTFCQTAASVGRDAIFAPRGQVYKVAQARMMELRASLTPWGEQRFPRYIGPERVNLSLPRLDAICWDKKGQWVAKKCGIQNWPPVVAAVVAEPAAPSAVVAAR